VGRRRIRQRLRFPIGIKAQNSVFEGNFPNNNIHETLIKSAADLISENTPDYQYLAAR